jgi:hypothetical protein
MFGRIVDIFVKQTLRVSQGLYRGWRELRWRERREKGGDAGL